MDPLRVLLRAGSLGEMSRCLSPTSGPTMVIGDLRSEASPPDSPSSPLTDDTYDNTIEEDPDSASEECGSKKTAGRRKIGMKLIDHKQKRNATFHKRKSGLMKKGFELSKLTGAEVFVMAVWDKAVFSYGTKKLERILTVPNGKDLVRYCIREPVPAKDEVEEPQEWSRCHIKQDVSLSLDDQLAMTLGNPDLQGPLGSMNCWDQSIAGIENPHLADMLQAQWKQPQAMPSVSSSQFPMGTSSPLLGRGCQMPSAFGMPSYYGGRPSPGPLGMNPMMSSPAHMLPGDAAASLSVPPMLDGSGGYALGGGGGCQQRMNGAFMPQGLGRAPPAPPQHRSAFHDAQAAALYDCAMHQQQRAGSTKPDMSAASAAAAAAAAAAFNGVMPPMQEQHQHGRQFSAASIDLELTSTAVAAAAAVSVMSDDALSFNAVSSKLDEPNFFSLDDFP